MATGRKETLRNDHWQRESCRGYRGHDNVEKFTRLFVVELLSDCFDQAGGDSLAGLWADRDGLIGRQHHEEGLPGPEQKGCWLRLVHFILECEESLDKFYAWATTESILSRLLVLLGCYLKLRAHQMPFSGTYFPFQEFQTSPLEWLLAFPQELPDISIEI